MTAAAVCLQLSRVLCRRPGSDPTVILSDIGAPTSAGGSQVPPHGARTLSAPAIAMQRLLAALLLPSLLLGASCCFATAADAGGQGRSGGGSAAAAPLVMHHIGSCSDCGRSPQGSPGSWCPCPSKAKDPACAGRVNTNCTEFVWDSSHLKGPPLSGAGCAALPKGANPFCLKGTQDLWAAVPCPGPCHVPAPPPPHPTRPAAPKPIWHLPGRSELQHKCQLCFQFVFKLEMQR